MTSRNLGGVAALAEADDMVVFRAAGALSGAENLSSWQIKHNGVASSGYRMKFDGETLVVESMQGMLIFVR